jgi:DNA polymerase III epsilon subunit-like protein
MSEIFDKRGVMVDIETLSQKSNAAIVSVGAVKFSINYGISDKFKVNVDPMSCKEAGLRIDKDTLDWWAKQSPEARRGWQENPKPIALKDALEQFIEWWGKDDRLFWCQGLSFDSPILSNAFDAVGLKRPWHYRKEMDTRTLFNFVGHINSEHRTKDTVNVYHDSLGDAIAQTEVLIKLFKGDK